MKPGNAERRDIVGYCLGPANNAEQNIGRDVVALRYCETQKLLKGHVDVCTRMLLLKGTIRLWQDAVIWPKPNMLIERKRTLLYLMQDGQSQGQLENRLHWCLRIAVDVAIE